MKYSTEVMIELPRERVIELFDSAENLPKWQPSLRSMEHLVGDPGQPGAKTSLSYDEGNRKIEMVETILERDFPDRFTAKYETQGVVNISVNSFEPVGSEKTRWVAENEFRFSGMMRLVGFFMRGAFPKQTEQTMNAFKEFAETSEGGKGDGR